MKSRPKWSEMAPDSESERQRKRDAIARGRTDVAAGRVVDHDDVQRWVESWGGDAPSARPTPRCRSFGPTAPWMNSIA
jgi:predicted transcriptional regulator